MSLVFLLIRLLLAVIFVVAGFTKLADLANSRQILQDLGVPAKLAAPLGVLLPLAKLVVAVALIFALTAWWAALVAGALFLLSVAGMGYNLVRRRQPVDQLHKRHSWSTLGSKLVLVTIAGFLVWQGQQGIGPSMLDWLTLLTTVQRIELLVAVILLALVLLESWVQFHALSQQGRMLLRIEALEGHPATDKVEILSFKSSANAMTNLSIGSLAPLSSPLTATNGEVDSAPPLTSVSLEPTTIPSTTTPGNIELTIGMATYDDFDGVYFTLQALRLYQDLENTELLVIDNYGCEETKKLVERWIKGARYIRATDVTGTAAPRDLIFKEARGNAVLCCDCHVLFAPGAIAQLKQFYRDHPYCHDLLQGPLLFDDMQNIATHFEPQWRAQMWGTWGNDPRGKDPKGEPFEIPMQGLGAFSCLKRAWLGFNPEFRGFGGEEGYIHEKFRQAGRRCLCLPWFLWMHRFGRPSGVKYTLTVEEKLRNYVIGHTELGLDLTPVLQHFAEHLSPDQVQNVTEQALEKLPIDTAGYFKQTVSAKEAQAPSQAGARPVSAPETLRVVAVSNYSHTASQLSQRADSGNSAQIHNREKVPLASVVLPVYNGEQYLRAAVESLLGQSLQDIEIIIINDGSTDRTHEIINELIRDPRVKAVDQSNMGMAQARNRGIALARAKYIVAHDADDISLPDRLQKQYTFLEQSPDCGLIGAYMELIDEAGQVFRSPEVSTDPHTLQVAMVEPTSLLARNHFVHGSVMMRKSACEAVGQYRDVFLLADDYDLWLRMAEKYPMGNMVDVLYQYRDYPESISKKNVRLLHAYTQIAVGLARERQQSGSDLLMREGSPAFWHKYGAKLRAVGLPDAVCEPALAL